MKFRIVERPHDGQTKFVVQQRGWWTLFFWQDVGSWWHGNFSAYLFPCKEDAEWNIERWKREYAKK